MKLKLSTFLFAFGFFCLLLSVNSFALSTFTMNGGLPYTGFCEDYLLHFSDEDPSVWQNSQFYIDRIEYWGNKGYNTMRLGFEFGTGVHSTYVEWKMDQVVAFFASHGYASILDMHDNAPGIYGSQTYVNQWLSITTHYKGNGAVAGFNIANEPQIAYGASTGPVGAVNSNQQLVKAFVYLAREIHKIDPTRTVFFPNYVMMGIPFNTWYSYIVTASQQLGYDILNDAYVIWDITHPYYFENGWDWSDSLNRLMTPEEKAVNYATREIAPAVAAFGADKCWCGETFGWYGTTPDDGYLNDADSTNDYKHVAPHQATYDLQYRWEKAIINQLTSYNVPFQVGWTLSGSTKYTMNAQAMEDSNYEGQYIPLPPPTNINLPSDFTITITGFGAIGAAVLVKRKEKR